MFRTLTRWTGSPFALIGLAVLLVAGSLGIAEAKKGKNPAATGTLIRSKAVIADNCLPDAQGKIEIFKAGPVEKMTVSVQGMPKNKEFDVFVIQAPDNPFGLTWYQGDIETDKNGKGSQQYVGRFSIETFIVGVGTTAAPVVHHSPIADAAANNAQNAPVHTFHVGVWFNSVQDQVDAGCGSDPPTPFNGDHTAGEQVLTTVPVNVEINGVNQLVGPLAQVQ
jgi:hypothetical protein